MESELEYVKARLAECTRSEWFLIAEEADVPFSTVKRIGYKQTKHPRSDTVGKIAACFRAREAKTRRNGHKREARVE